MCNIFPRTRPGPPWSWYGFVVLQSSVKNNTISKLKHLLFLGYLLWHDVMLTSYAPSSQIHLSAVILLCQSLLLMSEKKTIYLFLSLLCSQHKLICNNNHKTCDNGKSPRHSKDDWHFENNEDKNNHLKYKSNNVNGDREFENKATLACLMEIFQRKVVWFYSTGIFT